MIACDRCRDVNRSAGEFKVAMTKVVQGEARASRSEVKSGSVELCDQCVDAVWTAIKKAFPGAQLQIQTESSPANEPKKDVT